MASLAAAQRHVAEAAASDPTFLVIGDWGKGSADQRKVAAQAAKTAKTIDARFVISTGDNFDSHGVKSVDDALWRTRFEDIYDAPALMIPRYVVLGNHDHYGTVSAQVAYTNLSSRWRLPATYYKHTELLADGSTADFFHLDTTPIKDRHVFEASASPPFSRSLQLVWLERKLATSAAAWKIVIGHHPVHSGGKHRDTEALIIRLKPLLERFGVQIYLNGHNHNLEHVVVGRTHYLTSGVGAKAKPAKAIEGTQFVMGDRLGFMTARLAPAVVHIEFIDEQGTSLYRATIPRDPAQTYWKPVHQHYVGERSP